MLYILYLLTLLTSAIDTLPTIRFSSILSPCANHLWSTRLANSHCINVHQRTSSFLTLSIRDTSTKQTTKTHHLKNIHFPSLSNSHAPFLCPVQRSSYNFPKIASEYRFSKHGYWIKNVKYYMARSAQEENRLPLFVWLIINYMQ